MTFITQTAPRGLSRMGEAGLAAAAFAVLANHWLWGAWPGVSLALTILLGGGVTLAVHRRAPLARLAASAALFVFAAAALVEAVSLLSFIVAAGLAAGAVLIASRGLPRSISALLLGAMALLVGPAWRLPRDLWRLWRARRRRSYAAPRLGGTLRAWSLPLGLGAVFVALFAEANPIIGNWLAGVSLFGWLDGVWLFRGILSLMLAAAIWPALRPAPPFAAPGGDAAQRRVREFAWLGAPSILRALILFNAIFAAQTSLDASILWGGAALPDGMTYAEYAHRGAYPLIVTALLAAGFVLVALRQGSEAAASATIRRLVYAFLAQNVALVVSSIYRLDLYVEVYGLTYLRIAAFIWMGLVAFGLVLIAARIVLEMSGNWLIAANLGALGLTLYACCFVNFAAIVMDHNTRDGARLDLPYLASFDARAIPAVDRLIRDGRVSFQDRDWLEYWRESCRRAHLAGAEDWRSWTRRNAALTAYLDANPEPPHTPLQEAPL